MMPSPGSARRAPDEAGNGVASDEVADELGGGSRGPRRRGGDRRELAVRHDVREEHQEERHPQRQVLTEGHDHPAEADRVGERDRHEPEHHGKENGPLPEQQACHRGQHDHRTGPSAAVLQPVE